MASEGEYPKTDGDIIYASDDNRSSVYQIYDTFEQETLSVTNVSSSVSYSAESSTHLIKNIGSKNCYINFDAAATTSSYLLYAGATLSIDCKATAIHAITSGADTTTLRIIGLRN